MMHFCKVHVLIIVENLIPSEGYKVVPATSPHVAIAHECEYSILLEGKQNIALPTTNCRIA